MSCPPNNIDILAKDINIYAENFYRIAEDKSGRRFSGPSIHFHEQALLSCQSDFLSDRHLEYVYATLVSWGMHRMGKRGAKMPDFDEFKASILSHKDKLREWQQLRIENISPSDLDLQKLLPDLTEVCFSIKASESNSHIVSSSKTLAHILPNLVCPMDRQYTFKFFGVNVQNTDEKEIFQMVMKEMCRFYHIEGITSVVKIGGTFAHSYPKMFDNLIIEFIKAKNN